MDISAAENLVSTIGSRIRTLRESRSWTQETLAEHVEMSAQAVARIERGEASPSLLTTMRFCLVLDVDPNSLLAWEIENDLERHAHLQRLAGEAKSLPVAVVERLADLATAIGTMKES